MATLNRQWLLKGASPGVVGPQHFERVSAPMPQPDLAAGQVLLKTLELGQINRQEYGIGGPAELMT